MTLSELCRLKQHALTALESATVVYYSVDCDHPVHKVALDALHHARLVVQHLMDEHYVPDA